MDNIYNDKWLYDWYISIQQDNKPSLIPVRMMKWWEQKFLGMSGLVAVAGMALVP